MSSSSSCESDLVNKIVSEYAVVVFSRHYQQDSFLPLKILSQYPIRNIKSLNLDESLNETSYLEEIKAITGSDTILPKVFIGAHCFGGSDIIAAHCDGKLKELLAKAGAFSMGNNT